jgi:hypothetical protein
MKTEKNTYTMSSAINANPSEVTNRQLFKFFSLPVWAAIAISICLGSVTQTARAENTKSGEGHRGYKYIEPEVKGTKDSSSEKTADVEKVISSEQNLQTDRKIEPVTKPTDGKGIYPTFSQADIDGDHYITKYELKNYPYLLQVFDKVDAGKDGKLEQHEYQNLEMETKREGEVR